MIPQEGMTLARLEHLSRDLSELRKRIDQMPGREGLTAHKMQVRIAKTDSVGTYPTSGDTFNIIFVDGTYTEAEGNQTPTYTERQSAVGTYFVHNLAGEHIPEHTYIFVVRHNQKWWTFYKVGSSTNPIIRFQLTQLKTYGTHGVGKVVTWDGGAYTATGADIGLLDVHSVWPRSEIGWYGWAVQMSDRSPVTINGTAYTSPYDIFWCQGWPRFVEALLYENMGGTTTQQALATIVKAYGNADHGGQPDTYLAGERVILYDTRNRWPWAKTSNYAYAIYDEGAHRYNIVDLPETVGGGQLSSPGNYTASAEARLGFGGLLQFAFHNCTPSVATDDIRVDVGGFWEFACHGYVIGSNTAAVTQTGSQATIKIVRERGPLNVGVTKLSPTRLNSGHASVPFSLHGQRDDCLAGDKFYITVQCAEDLTTSEVQFSAHLIEPDTIGRPAPPVAPLAANQIDEDFAAFAPDPSFFDA